MNPEKCGESSRILFESIIQEIFLELRHLDFVHECECGLLPTAVLTRSIETVKHFDTARSNLERPFA
jgi:hypothetical protein